MSSHYYIVNDLPNVVYPNPVEFEKIIPTQFQEENDFDDGNENMVYYHQQYHNYNVDDSGTSFIQINDTRHNPFQEYNNHYRSNNNSNFYYDDLETTSESSLSLELEDDGDERVYCEKEDTKLDDQQQQYNIKEQRKRWNMDLNNKNSILYHLFLPIHQRNTESTTTTTYTLKTIPLEYRSMIQWIHREWICFCITLLLNFVATLSVYFDWPLLLASSVHISLEIALVEGVLYSIASYFIWNRPACNAFMTVDTVHRVFYLAFNAIHIIFTTYKLIGVPTTGSAGIVLLFILFSEGGSLISIVLTVLASISWLSLLGLSLYLYKETYKYFQSI